MRYRVSLSFDDVGDYEIVNWLRDQDNKQDAIRQAIIYYLYATDQDDDSDLQDLFKQK